MRASHETIYRSLYLQTAASYTPSSWHDCAARERCGEESGAAPTARRSSHPFDALAERFAQIFAERVSAALPKAGRNGLASRAGSSKRDMSCRCPGCKNSSKGPRFRFLCEEHLKLPKKKQDEVLAKWAERNS